MTSPLFTILIFTLLLTGNSHRFSRTLSERSLGFKKEKLSHLHFYFHDIVSGKNKTSFRVANASITSTSATEFGLMVMIDDPLTVGPDRNSKIVGRAQGLYASADLVEDVVLMVLNYVFVEGKYNGSTLSILGRNSVFSPLREMPIVGGTGLFRFARGYVHAKPRSYDPKSGDAVEEHSVYVLHY